MRHEEIVDALGANPLTGRSVIERILSFLGLEDPVALDTPVHLGPHPEIVEQVHLVPARDPTRHHPRVEQFIRPAQELVQGFGCVTLLERAVGQLRDAAGQAISARPAIR